MTMLAFVSQEGHYAIRAALAVRATLTTFHSFDRFLAAVDDCPFQQLVVDPGLLRELQYQVLLGRLAARPGRALLYSYLSLGNTARILAAARLGVGEFVLRGAADEVVSLRHRLLAFPSCSALALILERISKEVRLLPDDTRPHIVALFGGIALPSTVTQFAFSTNLRRRSLERSMQAAGFRASAADLVDCVRAARAWDFMDRHTSDLTAAAMAAGYQSSRLMRAHFKRLLSFGPGAARRELDLLAFSNALASRLITNGFAESSSRPTLVPVDKRTGHVYSRSVDT